MRQFEINDYENSVELNGLSLHDLIAECTAMSANDIVRVCTMPEHSEIEFRGYSVRRAANNGELENES